MQAQGMRGLKLRAARNINQTSLMKAGWNIINQRDDFWVQTMRSKYKCSSDLIPCVHGERPNYNLWRGISRAWPDVDLQKSCLERNLDKLLE